jgi:hypothetical protein
MPLPPKFNNSQYPVPPFPLLAPYFLRCNRLETEGSSVAASRNLFRYRQKRGKWLHRKQAGKSVRYAKERNSLTAQVVGLKLGEVHTNCLTVLSIRLNTEPPSVTCVGRFCSKTGTALTVRCCAPSSIPNGAVQAYGGVKV